MVAGVTSATRVVEMKDSEKGLLALALVGVYLYSSKKKPLKKMTNQGEMMATFSKADQELVKEGGGRMSDKQRVQLMKKNGWYAEGMHPDSTTFDANGTKV